MFAVSAMPGGVSSISDIPVDWVDDDELNAIERAYEAIPKRAKSLPESPRSRSSPSPQMLASPLSTSGPASVARAGFSQRTSPSTPQYGWRGQNPDRANSADFNLGRRITGGEEMRLGQVGFRAPSLSSSWRLSPCCAPRSQSSNQSQPFNENIVRSEAGGDAGCSANLPEACSNSQAAFGPRVESGESAAELAGVDMVEIGGAEGRPAEGRKVRQLPPWMQTTDSSSVQDGMNSDVMAGRSSLPADLERRSEEAASPAPATSQLDHQPQPLPWRMPWNIRASRFVDNVKPQFPIMQFRGEIVYSKTELEVKTASLELCKRIRQMQAATPGPMPIGFDLEWRANFERASSVGEEFLMLWNRLERPVRATYTSRQPNCIPNRSLGNQLRVSDGERPSRVAVLQLCLDARRCDVMQIIYSGITPSLQNILEDPSTIKVGVGIHGDVRKLHLDYGPKARKVVDLRVIANKKFKNLKQWSLASLAFELTGKQIDKNKSIQCGDWEANPLSKPQLVYAATDAFASLHLYQILSSLPNPESGEGGGSANASETPG